MVEKCGVCRCELVDPDLPHPRAKRVDRLTDTSTRLVCQVCRGAMILVEANNAPKDWQRLKMAFSWTNAEGGSRAGQL